MAFDLNDCSFSGPALPEPFAKFELEGYLAKSKLLPTVKGEAGRAVRDFWDFYRRKLRNLGDHGGPIRVLNHAVQPLADPLGYRVEPTREADVTTREGSEDGGWLFKAREGTGVLRAWAVETGIDLDAPSRRGHAYRFSPTRIAHRVLLAKGERIGLLTDGAELRVLLCDPSRPDSHLLIRLDRGGGWRGATGIPDSFRLFSALASPAGVTRIPTILEQARLTQTRVTAKLREQAKAAISDFVQCLLDRPENREMLASWNDRQALARELWREGLVLVYRLLFVLKLEASSDPARAFSFASTSLWRNSYSPNTALARHARAVLDQKADTGRMLEDGLRTLFRLFSEGLTSSELKIAPLGGMLFGDGSTPWFDRLSWGEEAPARLLDRLLWTPAGGKLERQRVHYGPLDVEDLGRVYEALLEREPGIATEPMCRLRRQKLEVVVPIAQGERYRSVPVAADAEEAEDAEQGGDEDEESPKQGEKTRIEWIEEIRPGRFYLRVGLGRKSTGSYYTPHAFVRFLVQETLGPQVEERSPNQDPKPAEILRLKVLDPAMGSGHFLVEACRYLGEKVYEACRLCDELALAEDDHALLATGDVAEGHRARAAELRRRVDELPDPNDELAAYLPSRVPEGQESGLSQQKALAIARRLVAVHCLYGVDKNPLAVELAKLSLWLESYAEGLPLTFLDHRLVCGDSLTGPFFEHLLTYPGTGQPLGGLFAQGLREKLAATLGRALVDVRELERSVGKDVGEVEAKRAAMARLDEALTPFRMLARAWSGGVMLGDKCDDGAYEELAQAVVEGKAAPQRGLDLAAQAPDAWPYDVAFPEVFFPEGRLVARGGFDAVVTNPPWDAIQFKSKEFFASIDFEILNAPTKRERVATEDRLRSDPTCSGLFSGYVESFERLKRVVDRLYEYQKVFIDGDLAGRQADAFRVFMERNAQILGPNGRTGCVVPSAFHANEGATGIRRLYLDKMVLRCCYSFENRHRLFEIDSRFKFALVVAQKGQETGEFPCAFYLHDDGWMFGEGRGERTLTYTRDFVRRTGGEYLSLLELRSQLDLQVAERCFVAGVPFSEYCHRTGITLRAECHMTNDAWRFSPAAAVLHGRGDPRYPNVAHQLLDDGYVVLHEGKTFRQFDDRWGEPPRYVIALANLQDKGGWLLAARYYRLAYRNIAGPGDQNVAIWNLHPAGVVTGEKGPSESAPGHRKNADALTCLACWNTMPQDFLLQLRVRATVSQFMILGTPVPSLNRSDSRSFLGHGALRLSCNHSGYAALWQEQLGSVWREPDRPAFTWPVLEGDDARWAVRAAIDAVVADAYGLSRAQYQHVLASFSHKSYPKAPGLCLAAFDELKQLGLDAFCKKHDPYWDIPLNEQLPKPVIDLPIPDAGGAPAPIEAPNLFPDQPARPRPARGKRRR